MDAFKPQTGEVISAGPEGIACWMIDTDYNEESFFVRHAYFTGAEEPYEKLKRALRAEIDEAAWSQLYTTTSYPFEKPRKGKIARPGRSWSSSPWTAGRTRPSSPSGS